MNTPIDSSTLSPTDERACAARDWALAQVGPGAPGSFRPASADASFRRYFRLQRRDRSWIVMDAPPQHEDTGPFVAVAALLQQAGLHVPQVLAQDRAQGFLLLTDLGRQTYLDVLDAANADALMTAAIDALIRWQQASRHGVLPPYDEALLQRELALFEDWYVARHLRRALEPAQQQDLAHVCRLLVASALAQPRVYVHRDYMPRNLMRDPARPDEPGVLDFQDAVEGPISYDLISLLRDAFLSWPIEQVEAWMRQYWEAASTRGLPVDADFAEFRRAADWMGVQRHLKVIGIFARIRYRDGKPRYLADVPRFIGYVRSVAVRYPELAPLLRLFDALDMQADVGHS